MPQLILMRHAKAVDRMEAEDDFDRALTPRGHEDADRAAAALAKAGFRPELALVSPARRTLETWTHLESALGQTPVESPMALYHASTAMLHRAVIDALSRGADCVGLVGHNPGIGGLAHDLGAGLEARTGWPYGWPTSAALIVEVETTGSMLRGVRQYALYNPKG